MTPILRAHTRHPEVCPPRDPTIANCVTQTLGNQPTIEGPSLSFEMTTRGVCLLHSIRHRQCHIQPLAHICRCAHAARAVHFHPMHDLFAKSEAESLERVSAAAPLAARMRPRTLDEFVGQEHILASGKLLRRAIEADRLPSLIISGPPGSGKTTLAYVIAEMTHSEFIRLSGVESNVAEMRKVVAAAANRLRTSGRKTIVFIDEIHHFNKAQQDILLPDVESGNLRLIGATTYNPYFYVNSALVSRSLVFRLEPLTVEQLEILTDRALADSERGLGKYNVKMAADARRHLAKLSDGDARKCLNALEVGVLTTPPVASAAGRGKPKKRAGENQSAAASDRGYNQPLIHFTLQVAEESIQTKAVVYDKKGDAHYDTISAFIKSMRASDEKSAIYWLAKMLHAGEDFRFIARRIVIFASEDVGLADPEALPLAIAAQQAVEFVGMPEARIPLAHATAYMCRAKKSREAYEALAAATEEIESEQTERVPEHLKNKHFPVNPEG
jgi:putative ATPase